MNAFEAYSLSPAFASVSVALLVSYVAMALFPSTHVFATVSNICYIGAGFYREATSFANGNSATLLVGQLGGGSLVLVLMGASSFAFHREYVIGSPAHTLDILFGWVLVAHVLYVCFSVATLGLMQLLLPYGFDELGMHLLRTVLSLLMIAAYVLLMTFYDDLYANQQLLYFTLGPLAAVFGGVCRFMLVYNEGAVQGHAFRVAVVEVVIALTATLAAIITQGELLGRKVSAKTLPREYDFFHGQWHFLLAAVTSLLYSRAADAARAVHSAHSVCVCSLPHLDRFALGLLFVYSVTAIGLKEAAVDIDTSIVALATIASFFAMHVVAVLYVQFSGDDVDKQKSRGLNCA